MAEILPILRRTLSNQSIIDPSNQVKAKELENFSSWFKKYFCNRCVGVVFFLTYLNNLCLSRLGFEHQTFRMRVKRLNRLRHCNGITIYWMSCINVFVFTLIFLLKRVGIFRHLLFIYKYSDFTSGMAAVLIIKINQRLSSN